MVVNGSEQLNIQVEARNCCATANTTSARPDSLGNSGTDAVASIAASPSYSLLRDPLRDVDSGSLRFFDSTVDCRELRELVDHARCQTLEAACVGLVHVGPIANAAGEN